MNEQKPRPDQNQKRNPGGVEAPDTEDQETPGRGNPPSSGGIDPDRGTGSTGTGGGFNKK